MFLTENDKVLSEEYVRQGYIIRPAADLTALEWMRSQYYRLISELTGIKHDDNPYVILNEAHKYLTLEELNSFRLKLIQKINAVDGFREMYFRTARPYLETLVGNELAMQLRVNLSIQLPNDKSSLLPVHADTWSGDSPFEIVVWIPLVNCYRTKAMYLLPPKAYSDLNANFSINAGNSSESLYQRIKPNIKWLEIDYGEILLFDQSLPHGNRINQESETRWSMNCRFKGVFTPYGDKKLGEFFEPITLRVASQLGMTYQLPKI